MSDDNSAWIKCTDRMPREDEGKEGFWCIVGGDPILLEAYGFTEDSGTAVGFCHHACGVVRGVTHWRSAVPPKWNPDDFDDIDQSGKDRLWRWFSLSYASWLSLPRVLMHEMPDEWQQQMAKLLEEFDGAWQNQPDVQLTVSMKRNGKFIRLPDWLNYRHPDYGAIDAMRGKRREV